MEYQYLVSDVLKAMQKHELKVYYQPKFDALANRMKSAEALVRWVRAKFFEEQTTGKGGQLQ